MKDFREKFLSSVMAGIAISLGCIVNVRVGGLAGAVLFTFGLLTVVHYKLLLFTGTAGFVNLRRDWGHLLLVLGGNIVGCGLTVLLGMALHVQDACADIVAQRVTLDAFEAIFRAIGCGFIMTTAVEFARKDKYLPLLFGVPLFIMAGFIHSIADAFYCLASFTYSWQLLGIYLCAVVGNYLGCNLYKMLIPNWQKKDN